MIAHYDEPTKGARIGPPLLTIVALALLWSAIFIPANTLATGVRITADFRYEVTGTEVTFSDHSSGLIVNWSWSFGDGSPIAFEKNPVHEYTKTGKFLVTLRIVDFNKFDEQTERWIKVDSLDTGSLTVLIGFLTTVVGVVWIFRAEESQSKMGGVVVIIVGILFLCSLALHDDLVRRILELVGLA